LKFLKNCSLARSDQSGHRSLKTQEHCQLKVGFRQIIKLLFKRKNASAALPGSVTSADFNLSPGTISALTGT